MTTWLQVAVIAIAASIVATPPARPQENRPNVVWIVLDDASPTIGAYGDTQAVTPNIDRLARDGVRFARAYTHAPVCSASRSGLVTGRYPTSLGTHHHRSRLVQTPDTFMALLRKAGYFVAWPGKTDFNFGPTAAASTGSLPPEAADSTESWLDAAPPRQPFFAYLNVGVTHEAQVRAAPEQHAKNTSRLRADERHDPARIQLPPFLPDAPEVRQDLAQYYDLMTAADYRVGDVMAWLEKHALASNTVVMVFSDHGTGMPRSKRWLYPSGIHVPLVVRWPGRISAGSVRSDLVGLVDFAPTILSLARAPIPQGLDGQVFLGPARADDRSYVYAHRDRMDETEDRVRSVIDARYQYIRNFHPDRPYTQINAYNEENPTMKAWRRLHAEGRLTGAAAAFFAPARPAEELYDLRSDPHALRNLAADASLAPVLGRLRGELDRWMVATKDLGAVPESELVTRGILARPN